MNSRVSESSRRSFRKRLTICAWIETSSEATGSSQTSTSGRMASARAMATRWRWPPENWWGKRSAASAGRPTAANQRATSAFASPRVTRPCATGPSAIVSPTRMRGSSEPNGSWKIICTRVVALRRLPPGRPSMIGRPSMKASPALGAWMPAITRPSVDLPQPDSPTSPSASPRAISKETPSTAWTVRVSTAAPSEAATRSPKERRGAKRFETPSTRIRASLTPPPSHPRTGDGSDSRARR